MKLDYNPFEYEAANNLSDEMIADYYIDDFNYSRFIQSRRNILLVGERGTGKTMALLYNKWRLQRLLAERSGTRPSLALIGVYVPCNTPLTYRPEYELLDQYQGAVLSEHFLVLSIAYSLSDTLSEVPALLDRVDQTVLRNEARFVLGAEEIPETSFFDAMKQLFQRELLETQRALNQRRHDAYYNNTFSFASVLVPLLTLCVKRIPKLAKSHFLLLLDDAQSLNPHQAKALNSWNCVSGSLSV